MKKLIYRFCLGATLILFSACGGGGTADQPGTQVGANHPPVAVAGANQTVDTGTMVLLDGTGSSDPDGDLLTWHWLFVSKPPSSGKDSELLDSIISQPSFTPDVDGDYVLKLEVHDGKLKSAPSFVTITARSTAVNNLPLANAGANQQVTTGDFVTLDGTASSDPDSDPLTFAWSFLSGPADGTLPDSSAVQPTFAPQVEGRYVFSLVVSDGVSKSDPAIVVVTASSHHPGPCSVDDFLLPDTTNPLATSTFTYQAGLLVQKDETGFLNRTTTYEYVSGDLDLEIVNDPEEYEEKKYSYQGGRISRIEHVWAPDGPIEAVSTYEYNEAPPQVVITYDDAVLAENERSFLDINDHGDVIWEVVEFPVGTLQSTSTFDYIYDAAGNILERNAVLEFSNGTSEEIRSTFDYSCWQ